MFSAATKTSFPRPAKRSQKFKSFLSETSETISTNSHHINNHHHRTTHHNYNNNTKSKTFNCTNCETTFIFEHLYQKHLTDNRCPMFDLDDGEPKEMVINDQMLSAVDALGDRQKDHIFESSEHEIQTELDILSDGEIGISDLLDEEMTAFVDQIQDEPFPNCDLNKPRTKKHEKDVNGNYSCFKCDKVYDNYKTFMSHIRGHERRYVCTYCSKGFPQSTHLKAHLFIHTGERPYKCDVCSATFNALGSLRGHKRIHSGERPYPCDYCDKSFLTSSARTIHHRQHTKEIRFVCNVCNKGYINKHLYITHMNKHNNKRDFACETCDQKFFDKWTWKKHQVVHVNDRKFVCDVCDAKFPRERTLREHKKLHSKIKEYKCTSCNKEFAQYAGLYSHMKRQHRID